MKQPRTAGLSNADYLRKLRAEAKAKGYCGECRARPAKPGRTTCETCLEKHAERDKAYRAVGLCACGVEPEGGFSTCERCRAVSASSGKRRRIRRKALGLCLRNGCGESAAPGRVHCMTHLAEQSATVQARKRLFAAIGFCVRCQKAEATSETMCDACLDGQRKYSRRRQLFGTTRKNYKHTRAV